MDIRILTLWQPWASLIALGLKQYETRSWGTDYRGKLVIHAAKRPIDKDGSAVFWRVHDLKPPHKPLIQLGEFPFGCIVAIADLIDCCEMIQSAPLAPIVSRPIVPIDQQTPLERAVGNWQPGRFAWKLENVRSLAEPIPYQGGQGLRRIANSEIASKLSLL